MMGNWRKKPQSKQNINPVGFPPSLLLCYGESTVFWYLDRAQKQAEAFPIVDEPKAKRDKRTNEKGRRSGKGNEHGIQKYVTKILKRGPGLQSGRRVRKETGSGEDLEGN